MKRTLFLAATFATLTGSALGQYKVIGADGSVTYTDRPPTTPNAKITALGRRGDTSGAVDASLPFELRQVASRFPVTLYTSADCPPCDAGRQFLQQRGVPYSERRVSSEDDAAALERAVGGRTVPALTIGSQALRGLSQTDWTVYLDAAGYPRESKLPRNWQPPAPTALVERAAPVARAAAPAPAAPPQEAPAPPADSTIKF
jgi:glutaredoxin